MKIGFSCFGVKRAGMSVPCAHGGCQLWTPNVEFSVHRATSDSSRRVLLTAYYKAHPFSCYNHPSEKTNAYREPNWEVLLIGKCSGQRNKETGFSATLL